MTKDAILKMAEELGGLAYSSDKDRRPTFDKDMDDFVNTVMPNSELSYAEIYHAWLVGYDNRRNILRESKKKAHA